MDELCSVLSELRINGCVIVRMSECVAVAAKQDSMRCSAAVLHGFALRMTMDELNLYAK